MPAIIKVLQTATAKLARAGIEQPRSCAEWLLSDVLQVDRPQLYHRDTAVTYDQLRCYDQSVENVCHGVPVEYHTGYVEFDGLRLAVGPGAFIPRPETEILVEVVRQEFGEWSAQPIVGIDLGVGSGNISISLTKSNSNCRIIGVDCSREALFIARENVVAHALTRQVMLVLADWRQLLSNTHAAFDLMVSNPPYIASDDIPLLPAVVRSEPRQALDGGEDGLAFIRELAACACQALRADGLLAFEIGSDQSTAVVALLETTGKFHHIQVFQDLAGRDRVITARRMGRSSAHG